MSRLFIVDAVCAQLLGHNYTLVTEYRKYFLKMGKYAQVIPVVTKILPFIDGQKDGLERRLNFLYYDVIKPSHLTSEEILAAEGLIGDESVAVKDFEKLFKDFDFGPEDTIFYPSVDFFGLAGLLTVLKDIPVKKAPKIHARFIGVLENASKNYPSSREELFNRIGSLQGMGHRFEISSETPKFADYLSSRLGVEVHVTPMPLFNEMIPLSQEKPFTVISPGSGRLDKGFLKLNEVIEGLLKKYPLYNIQFEIQNLPPKQVLNHKHYVLNLYSLPRTKLHPATISIQEMQDMYKRSHLVIMPYERTVYNMRGSAILAESVSYGRQILAGGGGGYESQVEYYGLGKICNSTDDYIENIIRYYETPFEELANKSRQARARYAVNSTAAYGLWA